MDESSKQFEEWAEGIMSWDSMFLHSIFSDDDYHFEEIQTLWQAWKASREYQSVVAYLTHQGSAVSPDDFEGGEAEMHETAKREEWMPLVKKGE